MKPLDTHCKVALFEGKIFAVSPMGNLFVGGLSTEGEIKIVKQINLLEYSKE